MRGNVNSWAGIGPVNWFKLRSRKLSRLSRVNSRSTGPVNRFHDKERYCREGGRESSANEPERVLCLSSSRVRE